jgi:hypothetical protein
VSDPTAAERARRYRARRRQRDGSVTSREHELARTIAELVDEIRELRRELKTGDIHTVDNRDAVTRHADEGAHALAHVRTRLTAPTGPSEPLEIRRDVTPRAESVLGILSRAHSAQSAAAIGDALGLGAVDVIAELVALAGLGRVRRVPASSMRERDRWQLVTVAESSTETISCRAYREHQIAGHRRDPVTHRFRCYICDPIVEPIEAAAAFA